MTSLEILAAGDHSVVAEHVRAADCLSRPDLGLNRDQVRMLSKDMTPNHFVWLVSLRKPSGITFRGVSMSLDLAIDDVALRAHFPLSQSAERSSKE
jgi:hypothetical protein